MFDIPSNKKIEKCIVTKDTIENNHEPIIIENENKVQDDVKESKVHVEVNKETA